MLSSVYLLMNVQPTDKPPQEMTRLVQVLIGMVLPSESTPVFDLKFFDDSLNASQKEAVKFSLESPEVACIHGPPGGCIISTLYYSRLTEIRDR